MNLWILLWSTMKRLRDDSTIVSTDCFAFSYVHDEITIDVMEKTRPCEKKVRQKIGIGWNTRRFHEVTVNSLSRHARIRPTTTTLSSFVFLSFAQETRFTPVLHSVHRRMLPRRRTIAAYYALYTLATSDWAIANSESPWRESQEGSGDLVNPGYPISPEKPWG